MKIEFSPKQRRVLTWWRPDSPDRDYQAILCDGAVRSGKTLCTGISFFCWGMSRFRDRKFALCGKTIASVRRNLLSELVPILEGLGFSIEDQVSRNQLVVRRGRQENLFYLFGGRDESSAALVQGVTLAGALLDSLVFQCDGVVNCALSSPEEDVEIQPDQLPVLGILTVEEFE